MTIPQDPQDAKSSPNIGLLGLHLNTTKRLTSNHMTVKMGHQAQKLHMVKHGVKGVKDSEVDMEAKGTN